MITCSKPAERVGKNKSIGQEDIFLNPFLFYILNNSSLYWNPEFLHSIFVYIDS